MTPVRMMRRDRGRRFRARDFVAPRNDNEFFYGQSMSTEQPRSSCRALPVRGKVPEPAVDHIGEPRNLLQRVVTHPIQHGAPCARDTRGRPPLARNVQPQVPHPRAMYQLPLGDVCPDAVVESDSTSLLICTTD